MKLISLKANKKSFKTIIFKDGINLIVGKESNSKVESKTKDTYNGVGKSLIIKIIYFCLGSNKVKEFETKIPDWEFTLEFAIDEQGYKATRNTSKQNIITLNGEEYRLKEFKSIMLEKVFGLNDDIKNVTFNTLFSHFIRKDKNCYVDFDKCAEKEYDYQKLLNNALLLGFDIDYIIDKKNINDEQKSTSNIKKKLEKDKVFKNHFLNDEDIDVELINLTTQIDKLETELKDFKIANNYHQIEIEANEQSNIIKKFENQRKIYENNITQIKQTLSIEPHINDTQIIEFYKNANIEIPDMIVKNIEEVQNFHKSLIFNRKKRLDDEQKKFNKLLKELDEEIKILGDKLNKNIKYLDTHGALDEFVSINDKLCDVKSKKNKLEEYYDLLNDYNDKLLDIKKDHSDSNIQTNEYLKSIKPQIDNIKTIFTNMCKEMYGDKWSSFKIDNNTGENSTRFDINVKLQDDSSDGVNEVKIFCYDMLLLILNNTNMKFIFHDSRLFGNMDPRQRKILFEIANRITNDFNVQYIASINEDTLITIKNIEDFDYKSLIEDNVILELTDESDQSKLLGIQIDMNVT